jgi:hypothetical protein
MRVKSDGWGNTCAPRLLLFKKPVDNGLPPMIGQEIACAAHLGDVTQIMG